MPKHSHLNSLQKGARGDGFCSLAELELAAAETQRRWTWACLPTAGLKSQPAQLARLYMRVGGVK